MVKVRHTSYAYCTDHWFMSAEDKGIILAPYSKKIQRERQQALVVLEASLQTFSIHSSIHLSVHLSTHPYIHSSFHPSICLSIYPSISPSIHPSIQPLTHSSLQPLTHSSLHLSTLPYSVKSILLNLRIYKRTSLSSCS